MQPRFSFPGIDDYLSVQYTLSHGISPGRIQVVALAETINPQQSGTAQFSDPTTGVSFQLPDCLVDRPRFERQANGRTLARIDILDQRWRWQRFGQISGQWNVRRADGSSLVPSTEKTPRELLSLCFAAMGIDRPDLSHVPNLARPYVDWDIANPAQALAQIADTVGCVVVLKTGGKVAVEPIGRGKSLPQNAWLMAGHVGYDPPELSLGIEFFAGPTRYQIDAELEAVGEDVDGEIRPLDELRYRPSAGWHSIALPDCLGVAAKYRDLAKKSVWRMYRVKPPKYLPGVPKQRENQLHHLDELLPLLATQVESETMPDGSQQRRPAWVYGQFDRGDTDYAKPRRQTKVEPNLNQQPQDLYTRHFTLDRQRGIVHFAEPVFQWKPGAATYQPQPADLRIRLAVHWRRPRQRDLQHWSTLRGRKTRTMPPLTIHRNDIALEVFTQHEKKKVLSNEKEVARQANYYLDQALASLRPHEIGGASYVGLQPIEPDGAIRQVSWSINTQGQIASRTDASVNFDDPALDISYEERRLFEKLQYSLRKQATHEQASGVTR
ncbi:hypothetical protein DTL42_18260 [Bremerella cremea]|uniref:Uncharacterized protein n=1 Tax=Bremerella cremea TaxID=1031537 RepID=A0A368KMQ4_9BACT|nr:hypothetical protein [Bremerella cremea]RCS43930.1 hypothetical protein DTL42_18260 [Bremerella cremea]